MTDRLDRLAETGADVTIPAAALRELIPYVGHQPPGDPPPVDDQPPADPPDVLTILEERIPDLTKQTEFGGIDLPDEFSISWDYGGVRGPDNPKDRRVSLTIFEVHDGTKWYGRRRLACTLFSPKGSWSWFLRIGFGVGQLGGKTEWSVYREEMVDTNFVMDGRLVVAEGSFFVDGITNPAPLPDWRMPTGATLQVGHQDGPKGVPGEGDEPFASGSGSIEVVRLAPKPKATKRPEELGTFLDVLAGAISATEGEKAGAQPPESQLPADACAQRFADDLLEAKALEFLYEVEANTREGGHLAKVDVEKYAPLWLDAFSAWAKRGEPGPAWVPLGRSNFTVDCWRYLRGEAERCGVRWWTPGGRMIEETVGQLEYSAGALAAHLDDVAVDERALVAAYGGAALELYMADGSFRREDLFDMCRELAAREFQHLEAIGKPESHPLHGRILHLKSRRRRLENLARVEEIAAEADEVES